MANAGGAWDNAKKVVEVELKAKGTPLHDACVVGDTVGDPFKDTSSVAMNPVIKFTTLFGLLAVELAIKMSAIGVRDRPRRRVPRRRARLRLPLLLRDADRVGRPGAGPVRLAARGVGGGRRAVAELIAPTDPRAALRKALAALKVFPLHGVAVLPGTPAPFHVFEPRYRALVADALAGDRILAVPGLFGKSDAHALRPPVRAICGAGIVEVVERHEDGRYDIVLRGVARVRLLDELPPTKLYREFRAELVEDVLPPGGASALAQPLEALRRIVYDLSTRLPSESGAAQLAEAVAQMKDPSAVADLVAAAAVSDPEPRQKVLEEPDVARRLELVMGEVASVVLMLSKGGRGPKA